MIIEMKNMIIAFLLGIIVVGCSKKDDFTEEDCINSDYYYYENEKIVLNDLNYNYLIIGFIVEIDESAIISFINSSDVFENITGNDIRVVGLNNYRFVIAKFKERKSCIDIVSQEEYFVNQNLVVYANKVYNTYFMDSDLNFDFMLITDEFVVKLKEGTSEAQLENLVSQINGVSIIEKNEYAIDTYSLSNISKNRTTIKTVNLFFDQGLFEYVEPDIHYEIL